MCASHTIRRDATPRHATHELLSRFSSFAPTKRYKKIRDDRLGARFTRLRVYTPPIFLLSRGKFYGNLARNRIPSREELDDAVRARPSNFPTSIELCEFGDVIFQEIFDASLTAGKSRVWFFSNIHALRSVSSISRPVSTALMKISLFDEQEELNKEE